MWKRTVSSGGPQLANRNGSNVYSNNDDDDWETDPDYINDVSEEEQRWGGVRTAGAIDMNEFRADVQRENLEVTKRKVSDIDQARGFGGKFGIEEDRMDKSAVGHDYQVKLEKHASQKDYATGFGGKYGVQEERQGC